MTLQGAEVYHGPFLRCSTATVSGADVIACAGLARGGLDTTAARSGRLLSDFLSLAGDEVEDLAAFFECYGIPELCAHGLLPLGMRPHCPTGPKAAVDGVLTVQARNYRELSRVFGAVLALARRLNSGVIGHEDDWGRLRKYWPPPGFIVNQGNNAVADERIVLARWLTSLLDGAGVTLGVAWDEGSGGRPALLPMAKGLLGILAVHLCRAAGIVDAAEATCAHCQTPFLPRRRPRPGEALYCGLDECRRAQSRVNAQRYRQRQREGKGTS